MLFCDTKRLIDGISKIELNNKWYTVLYHEEDFVCIYSNKQFNKIKVEDVYDTFYRDNIHKDGFIGKPTEQERKLIIRKGQQFIDNKHGLDKLNNFIKSITVIEIDGIVISLHNNQFRTNDKAVDSFLQHIRLVKQSNSRININKAMTRNIQRQKYSSINALLLKYNIKTDSDILKMFDKNFFEEFIRIWRR